MIRPVVAFQKIPNETFPQLKEDVIEDLSTDQHYAYRICTAVMIDTVEEDLQCLEIDPIVYLRLLTLCLSYITLLHINYRCTEQTSNFGRVLHKSLFSNVV